MKAKRADKIATGILYVVSGFIVLILVALLGYILIRGVPYITPEFLTQPSKSYQTGGGIGVQLFNSLFLLLVTLIISVPISLGAGIYMAEYAKKNRLTAIIRSAIEILSSLPSVVVGLFGFLIFVIQMGYGFSILSGALALTFFNLPILTRNIEESLKAIHYTQREAGLALGLSRYETVTKIIVPEALPGILTGIIISAGRIFGEAAALIYTAGQSAPALDFSNWNPLSVSSPISIFRQAETLAVHIWKINTEGTMPDGAAVSAGASAVLIIVVLIFNFGARFIGNRLYKKMTSA
ncbi:phosphate ABC transporter permease PstA [Enterococcus timonensis]|uniref:phosphate ABC transporter permease PstA n=1 Tax=Enterococcus timonensis TaxID=1852364 RepID=UPI0008D92147|nr:phosphate ABC transporter permease PstA [Enterococcus timonensis]